MIVDELILKLQADLGDIKKSLKQVEADAAKAGKEAGSQMGKAAGTSFGDVFNAIAGAAVLNTVKGFFSKAAAEFNKMESAMMRVDSIAKGFGRSVEVAKKQVNELADKGFLNLNQAASGYADAIALGFDEKQARKFIDSLSDIAAFQNTIGNGAEAVQSGLAGLLSNSAEKVENIGVPIKVLNQEYQKNIATMGKAAALQKFYAATLKESEKFHGDAARSVDTLAGAQNKANAATDKAMVAIGKGLEPILKRFYNTLEDLAKGFANWFGGLDGTTKALALMAPLIGGAVLALGTMIPVLKAISMSNPFGWLALAISGLVALSAALNEMTTLNGPKIVATHKEQAAALKELGTRAEELAKINKRTAEQERELAESKDQLKKKAKELGVDYDKLAASAKGAGDMAQRLTNIQREQAAQTLQTERRSVAAGLERIRSVRGSVRNQAGFGDTLDRVGGATGLNAAEQYAERRVAELDKQTAELYAFDSTKGPAAAGSAGGKTVEQRFLESAQKITEIEKNRDATIRLAKGVKDEEERKRRIDAAIADANQQIEAEFTTRRQAYAEFIEDKYMADTEALKKSTDDAIRASNELLEAELKQAKGNEWELARLETENEERIQKIKEANSRKQAAITLQSFTDTANAANAITKSAADFARSSNPTQSLGATGSIFSAVGGIGEKFKNFGLIGQGLSAVTGVVSTLEGLFNKSDEQKAQEARKAELQRQEQLRIMELQANYQKNMLALQEAAAKLPFENLQRQTRLIDIETGAAKLSGVSSEDADAAARTKKLSALQGTFSAESGKIAQGSLFNNVGSTPDDLIRFLSERAAQQYAIAQFVSLLGSLGGMDTSYEAVSGNMDYFRAVYQQMQGYSGSIPNELYNAGVGGLGEFISAWEARRSGLQGGVTAGQRAEYNQRVARFDASRGLNLGTVYGLQSEVGTDTSRAESLLSVLEQSQQLQLDIAGNTKKTAENTSKALELRPDRERSFIDVGAGFIQSLGQRITSPSGLAIAQQLSQQNFSVSGDIGTASVTSSRARTLQERMADALEKQLAQGATANDILRDIRALTYDLIAVMDGDASTGSSFSQQDFINFSSDVKRRRVA